jgi:RNAse (barnase) inhibitor barstar
MLNQSIILDGNNFSSLMTFYDEVERQLTKNLEWSIGRNLDALNDILRGGFGRHEYDEPFTLVWLNSQKSQKDLGWEETLNYLTEKIKNCHPANLKQVKTELEFAKQRKGLTLYEILIDIIKQHNHVQLEVQ